MVFFGLLWSSLVFYGLLRSSMVYYGLLWSSIVFYGVPCSYRVFYGHRVSPVNPLTWSSRSVCICSTSISSSLRSSLPSQPWKYLFLNGSMQIKHLKLGPRNWASGPGKEGHWESNACKYAISDIDRYSAVCYKWIGIGLGWIYTDGVRGIEHLTVLISLQPRGHLAPN